MKIISLTSLLCLLSCSLCLSEELRYISGKVTKVIDGDSIVVTDPDDKEWKIRFYGVDTPEHKVGNRWEEQPHAKRSHAFTKGLILGQNVTVKFKMILKNGELQPDQTYNRYVGEVIDDGQSVNRELLRNGHAWYYDRYAKGDRDMELLMESAQRSKRGLWATEDPIPPWVWRR